MTWRTRNVCDLYPPGSWPETLAPYCGSKLGPIDWSAHPWPDDPVYGTPKTRREILGLPPESAEQATSVAGLGRLEPSMDPRTPRYVDYSNLNARYDRSVLSGYGGGSLGGSSLGTMPPQAAAGVGGKLLGLGEIPWQCWDAPGFKSCHSAQWEAARKMCDPNFGGSPGEFPSVGDCINVMSGALAENECVPQYCPETSPGGEVITGTIVELGPYPWMKEHDSTRGLQEELNLLIGEYDLDYCQIGVDGKLGPATCGLAKHMNENTDVPAIVPETCEAFATPAMCRVEEPPPAAPPEAPPITFAQPPPEPGISKASMWAIGGIVAALVIGGGYYLTQKKGG